MYNIYNWIITKESSHLLLLLASTNKTLFNSYPNPNSVTIYKSWLSLVNGLVSNLFV